MKIKLNRYFLWRTLQHLACRSITANFVCFTCLYSYTRCLTFAVRTVHYLRGLTTVHRLHPLLCSLLYDEELLAATPRSRLKECWLFTTTRWSAATLHTWRLSSSPATWEVSCCNQKNFIACFLLEFLQYLLGKSYRVFSSVTQTLGSPV